MVVLDVCGWKEMALAVGDMVKDFHKDILPLITQLIFAGQLLMYVSAICIILCSLSYIGFCGKVYKVRDGRLF